MKKVITILLLGLVILSGSSVVFATDYPVVFVSRNMVSNGNVLFPQATLIPGMGPYGRFAIVGGKLLIRNTDGSIFTLIDSTKNFNGISLVDVQQPFVSYDGNKIIFAGVESRDSSWRIYEIYKDGTGFKKLTFSNRNISLNQFGPAADKFRTYEDIDPIYLPDGRILFASTRYPTLSQKGFPATNLFVTDSNSTYIKRVTSERNSGEKPSINPQNGAIIYSRWWQNIDRPSNATENKITRDDNLALTTDFGNVWQVASCVTDSDVLKFYGGDPQHRITLNNYRGRVMSNGKLLSVFTPDRSMTMTSGSPGIRITDKGLSYYKYLAGVDTNTALLNPTSTYTYAGPYATDPAEMPDGRIIFSYALSPINSDYALYTYDLNTNTISPFYDIPGTLELNAEPLVSRPRPPLNLGVDDYDQSQVPPTTDPNTFYQGGLFRFDCLNVYANAPVDTPIDDAPPIKKRAKFQFFLNFQRQDPNGQDYPILFREIDLDFDGKIAQGDMPANVSMFEQMVDSTGKVMQNRKGNIAHVSGFNFGAQGSGTKCVGCHAGHTQISVANNVTEGGYTNLSTSALVTASSILNNDSSFAGQKVVDRKANNVNASVNWIANGANDQYVDLKWEIPIESRKIKLYNIIPNEGAGTNISVNDCEIFFYYKDVLLKYIPSTGPIPADGLIIPLTPVQKFDRMSVFIRNFTGKIMNKSVAGLAEIEVNAKISYDEPTGEPVVIPNTYYLNQNYPNPFNPTTKISFSLAKAEYARLEIFDITGRSVAVLISGEITEGKHTIDFSANSNFASGVYFYRLTTPSFNLARKMLLVK
ncbi:MAG: T9SS type A sorting domain-containing protein [Bacteroidetes bacterium]|nr:T9SS type A sorting domain-containing protein [Bacteroidota bacterium]